jgi:altronate dehydratase small subunit
MKPVAANWDAIVIAPDDNVAVALRDLQSTARLRIGDEVRNIALKTSIPLGHKFAIRDLASGAFLLKYGECIGRATQPIATGEHVHVHNLQSLRARGKG